MRNLPETRYREVKFIISISPCLFNSLDCLLITIGIDVADHPEPAANVTVRCLTMTAEVDWQPGHNGNDEVVSYTVFSYSLEAGGRSYEVAANSTSTLVPVHPWLNYTFHVEAHNKIGRSETSELVYCSTLQAAPMQHPHNVCTETRRSNQLVIVWQVTACISSILFSFSIDVTGIVCVFCLCILLDDSKENDRYL